jgi:Glycosyl transferase family 11
MITVEIIGGLGNQMFQYAAALALARRHGAGLRVDTSGFRTYRRRPYRLDKLNIPIGYLPVNAAVPLLPARPSAAFDLIESVLRRLKRPVKVSSRDVYQEPHFHLDPAFFDLAPPIVLHGYFQSERYFTSVADELRRHFQPALPLTPEAVRIAGMIDSAPASVSVHVRRGDYVSDALTARVHGALDRDYYRRALDIVMALHGSGLTFFLFSDEPDAASEMLDFLAAEQLVVVVGNPERPWEDMALMARCRHHVTANSSFSWWGAWLDPKPDKTVVAPRAWFSPDELRTKNTCDLCPAQWILV